MYLKKMYLNIENVYKLINEVQETFINRSYSSEKDVFLRLLKAASVLSKGNYVLLVKLCFDEHNTKYFRLYEFYNDMVNVNTFSENI